MKSFDNQEFIKRRIELEIGRYYAYLEWPDKLQASQLNDERRLLLSQLEKLAVTGYSGTKLDISQLSPGCELCARGKWSCLFINGKCNANCFYCPSSQDEIGIPQSNGIDFPSAKAWVDYIRKFNFKGLSLSGGEPFLTFDRSLEYLKAAKSEFNDEVYFWIYTNGILVTEDKLKQLSDAGLDEIRFDIGATNYSLKNVKKAIGIIPTVTVEIPAVPEKFERLKEKIREMQEIGVNYLNLHQLRMTQYNLPKFAERQYVLSHGEKVTVPQSELTALRLLLYARENKINLPINYCSFAFKNRYQHAAGRYRIAKEISEDYESITPQGYIRSLVLSGSNTNIQDAVRDLKTEIPGWKWYYEKYSGRIFIHPECLSFLDVSKLSLSVSYHVTRMKRQNDSAFVKRDIYMSETDKLMVERKPEFPEKELQENHTSIFIEIINKHPKQLYFELFEDEFWKDVLYYEYIPYNLPDYF
jgi:uncharacterized protein